MKKQTLLIAGISLLASTALFAATQFEDTFNVTGGGGGINYNYDESGRQSGPYAPAYWGYWTNLDPAPGLVTNEGPSAGKATFTGLTANGKTWVGGPNTNLCELTSFTVETKVTRLEDAGFVVFAVGKPRVPASAWVTPGIDIRVYPNGDLQVFDNWNDGHPTGSFNFAELSYASSPTLKMKYVCIDC